MNNTKKNFIKFYSLVIGTIVLLVVMLFVTSPRIVYDLECENGYGYELFPFTWSDFPIKFSYNKTQFEDRMVVGISAALRIWDDLFPADLFEYNENDYELYFQFETLVPDYIAIVAELTAIDSYADYAIVSVNSYYWNNFTFNSEITCESQDGKTIENFQVDFTSIILHETGHILGLNHSDDPYNTMYGGYLGNYQRTLSQGDIAGFCHLYTCEVK